MAKKPDLSRLVGMTFSPTEAAVLIGVLEAFLKKSDGGKGLHSAELTLIQGTIERLGFQLRNLNWPLHKENQAPYPV